MLGANWRSTDRGYLLPGNAAAEDCGDFRVGQFATRGNGMEGWRRGESSRTKRRYHHVTSMPAQKVSPIRHRYWLRENTYA